MCDILIGLPAVYQRVVSLCFNERKSDEDIARIMKRSVDAVRKLRYRALRLLAKKLDLSTSIGPSANENCRRNTGVSNASGMA